MVARTLLENTSDAVVILDPGQMICEVNAAFVARMGFSREEVIGRALDVIGIDEHAAPIGLINDTLSQEGRWRGILWIERRDGKRSRTLMTRTRLAQNAFAGHEVCVMSAVEHHMPSVDVDTPLEPALRDKVELRQALQRGDFEIFYQPQVELRTGRIAAVEALLRWLHPLYGQISPAHFLPLIEESGLILELGDWVLRTAATQLSEWREHYNARLRLGVNLSLPQVVDPFLFARLEQVLEETELPASSLSFEMQARWVMHYLPQLRPIIEQLVDTGFQLTLDDFGHVPMTIPDLVQIPVDTLKLDASFLQQLKREPWVRTTLEAMVALGPGLGLSLIHISEPTRPY